MSINDQRPDAHEPDPERLQFMKDTLGEFEAIYAADRELTEALTADMENEGFRERVRLASWTMLTHGLLNLELTKVEGMVATVKNSNRKAGKVPSWQGGRMPLSSELSAVLRDKLHEYHLGKPLDPELEFILPLIEIQRELSQMPTRDEFLIEYLKSDEGYHVFMYMLERWHEKLYFTFLCDSSMQCLGIG